MKMDDITDRNVEQLEFTGKSLGKSGYGQLPRARTLPGSRPDEDMVRAGPDHATINDLNNPRDPTRQSGSTKDLLYQVMETEAKLRAQLVDARNIIDNFERDMIKLESDFTTVQLERDSETRRADKYEAMVRKIAELVVNGVKE